MPAQEWIYHILGVMFSCHYFPLRDYVFTFEASKMYYFQQSAPNSEQQEQRLSPHQWKTTAQLLLYHTWQCSSSSGKSVHQQKVFPRLNEIQGFWTLEKPFFNVCSINWRPLNRYQQIGGSGCVILEATSASKGVFGRTPLLWSSSSD